MELSSVWYAQAIEAIAPCPAAVVATVHSHGRPVTDALKFRKEMNW
ncbi:MAG: hypothetical protein ACRDRX_26490 [Pseudonocardiaceae bacterium]